MTTVLQQLVSLDAKLAALALAKRHVEDVRLIQERSNEWKASRTKLTKAQARAQMVVPPAEEPPPVPSKRRALRQAAATILARLEADFDAKQLTSDAAWKKLLSSAEGVAEALDEAAREAWSAHLDRLGELEDPATLRMRAPPTPENEETLARYERSYAQYAEIRKRTLPSSADDLAQLETHIASCKLAYSRLVFDLPPAVKVFFESVLADSATLRRVTPEVLSWLTEKGQLDRFRVRSARS